MEDKAPFVSAATRAHVLIALLLSGMILNSLGAFSDLAVNRPIDDCKYGPVYGVDYFLWRYVGPWACYDFEGALFRRHHILNILQSGVHLATVLVFPFWFYRVHKNLAALNVTGLKYVPKEEAGGLFVPILNLWRPVQVMGEIWRASDPAVDLADSTAWRHARTSRLIPLWWLSYIAAIFFLHWVVFFLVEGTEWRPWARAIGGFIADLATAWAAIPAILLVREVTERQEQKDEALRFGIAPHGGTEAVLSGED